VFSFRGTKRGGNERKSYSQNDRHIFISSSAWTQNTDWLDKRHFLSPTASRKAGRRLSWLQKQKTQEAKHHEAHRRERGYQLLVYKDYLPD